MHSMLTHDCIGYDSQRAGFFCLPKTKDRTFEELDILFERKVPTCEFKDCDIRLVAGVEDGQKSSSSYPLSVEFLWQNKCLFLKIEMHCGYSN